MGAARSSSGSNLQRKNLILSPNFGKYECDEQMKRFFLFTINFPTNAERKHDRRITEREKIGPKIQITFLLKN